MMRATRSLLVRNSFNHSTRTFAKAAERTNEQHEDNEAQRVGVGQGYTASSVLPNGVAITGVSKAEDPLGVIGVFSKVGSATEDHNTHGSAHYLARFLYKSTNRTSGLRITRIIETLSTTFTPVVERTHFGFIAEVANDAQNQAELTEVMADLFRPRLTEWEHRQVRELVRHDVHERKKDIVKSLEDRLFFTAYQGVGLGRSPLCPEYNINKIYTDHLHDYVLDNVNAENFQVIGSVRTFPTFVNDVVNAFIDYPGNTGKKGSVDTTYYGGAHLQAEGQNAYAEVYEGVNYSDADYPVQLLAREILGDAYGYYVTKGRSSRLGQGAKDLDIKQANGLNFQNNATLFGVQVIGNAPLKNLAEFAHSQLSELASKKVSEAELERAKLSALTTIKARTDTRVGSVYYNLNSNINHHPDKVLRELKNVTAEQVQNFAKKVLGGKRTTVAQGDLAGLPTFSS